MPRAGRVGEPGVVLVAVTAAKGSPGVTTTTLALAATWPSASGPVVLECDPSGGDLGSMFALGPEPGLVSLAAGARRTADRTELSDLVAANAQQVPGGLRIVPSPVGGDAAAGAVEVLASSPALRARRTPSSGDAKAADAPPGNVPVLVDAGRLPARPTPGIGRAAVLAAADVVVLAVRNDLRGLLHATVSIDGLLTAASAGQEPTRVRVVVIGKGYPLEEVGQALGLPVAGLLPIDERAAAVLAGRPVRRPNTVKRAPLMRAAARISRALATVGAPGGGRPTDTPPPSVPVTAGIPVDAAAVNGSKEPR